jgi:hypothetical protein
MKVCAASWTWKYRRPRILLARRQTVEVPAADERTWRKLLELPGASDYSITSDAVRVEIEETWSDPASAPIDRDMLAVMTRELMERGIVIEPIEETAPDTIDPHAVWDLVFSRARVSIALTASTTAVVGAAALALASDPAVPRLLGSLWLVGLIVAAFVVAGLLLARRATRAVNRTAFPLRLKYVVPALGVLTTAVTSAIIAARADHPDLYWIGLVFGVVSNTATFGRLTEDEGLVMRTFVAGYRREAWLDWIAANHQALSARVHRVTMAAIAGVALVSGGAGGWASLVALALAELLRGMAIRLRRRADRAVAPEVSEAWEGHGENVAA